jgi:peptide/nickel transport system permease protein
MWLRIKTTFRSLPRWQYAVLAIILGTLFLTVFGPHLGAYSSISASPSDRLLPPSAAHWLGTDDNGIDILSRLLAAPRIDVLIALIATGIAVLVGAPIGVMVALFEGRRARGARAVAEIVMRFLEVIQAFPVFVFAMVLVAVFGGSTINIIAAVAFVNTPVFVRLVRADVLSLIQRPFAEAARAVGSSEARVGFRHVLPNAIQPVVVQVSVTVGFAILLTAGLSFVGAGVRPPAPELGSMIAGGAKFLIIDQWWPALFPGIALGLIVFSFGVFGEIVNKALEPRAVRGVDRRRAIALEAGGTAAPGLDAAIPRSSPPILAVRDLSVALDRPGAEPLLRDISFSLGAGECLGIVGESGSGKSLLVRAVLGLLPPQLAVTRGEIRYGANDLLAIDKAAMRALRSKHIAAILPNAKSQLHPLITVGTMMANALRAHEAISAGQARQRSIELLAMVGLADPERRLAAYPHELSGGMAQRVCLALALMYHPKLLVADEPTAGLDVTIQRQVLDLVQKLARDRGTAQLIVTGDLGIAAHYCDRIAVMQAGRIVELNDIRAFFAAPRHPYSRHLVACVRL